VLVIFTQSISMKKLTAQVIEELTQTWQENTVVAKRIGEAMR